MGTYKYALINLSLQFSKLSLSNNTYCVKNFLSQHNLLKSYVQPTLISWRLSHSFFSRLPAEKIWKGVTSVSPAGRRKGRGKGSSRRIAKDLNRGQVIGVGKKNMLWPGLNAPIIQGREVLRQQELPPDENREKRLFELRDKFSSRRRYKIHPLERGWSGTKLHGRSLGAPDPVGDETFKGFDSRVLQFRVVSHMHGQRGRVRHFTSIVVIGNKNGLGGFALGKSQAGQSAAKIAKNKAAKVLRYFERDNNTVVHDFYTEYGPIRIFVERRPEGFGLVCHRAIKAICEVIGIKDLYAKTEGSTSNISCLVRAFFIGLMKQKSLKEIANEKGLHIVKLEDRCDNFPKIVASPEKCRTEEEIEPNELCDFEIHLHKGRVVEERKKFQPFYINFPSYIKEMKDREKTRNHRNVRIHLLAKYDALKSFVQIREEEKAKKELKETVEEQS